MKICAATSCDRPAKALGWCQSHYFRLRRGAEVDVELRPYRDGTQGCVVDGCDQPHAANSLCAVHDMRQRRHGRTSLVRLPREGRDHNGTTKAERELLLAEQGHACAICRTPFTDEPRSVHVDHDHACCDRKRSCGHCVRGLLCGRCNVGIGMLGDSPDRLMAAAAYLNQHRDSGLSIV